MGRGLALAPRQLHGLARDVKRVVQADGSLFCGSAAEVRHKGAILSREHAHGREVAVGGKGVTHICLRRLLGKAADEERGDGGVVWWRQLGGCGGAREVFASEGVVGAVETVLDVVLARRGLTLLGHLVAVRGGERMMK